MKPEITAFLRPYVRSSVRLYTSVGMGCVHLKCDHLIKV